MEFELSADELAVDSEFAEWRRYGVPKSRAAIEPATAENGPEAGDRAER
jgi:hypothetical protein